MTRHPLRRASAEVIVGAADFAQRVIEPDDFIADTEAFVDVRLPGSAGKASYSFVGPGVSQNADQVVNLRVPHGFNVGAASMGPGVVNSPHLHFTAEVFICTRGHWRVAIGEQGEQTLDIAAGTVFSIPTWVFRGFQNIGDDDGWLFTILGGDDTGGVIWAPHVLRSAAETGLYLRSDHSLVDTSAGASLNDVIQPLEPRQLAGVDLYSDEELAACAVAHDDLVWSDRALLSTVVDGHESALAPVIGPGMTEDRSRRAPITTPHGFSVEWLRIPPGSSTGLHRHDLSQVLLATDGSLEITVNRGSNQLRSVPAQGSVISIMSGAWRNFSNVGDTEVRTLVVCGTDGRPAIEWDANIVTAALDDGWSRDAGGYIAPVDLVGRSRS